MAIRFVVLVSLTFSTAMAQVPQLQADASDAWNKRDWPRAAEAYAALVKADSTQALPRLRLGVALTSLGRYAEALPHIRAAERLGTPVSQAAFRLALINAGIGQIDEAFRELQRATGAGLRTVPNPGDSTTEMARLRRDARFAEFATGMDRNRRPCMYDAKYNEFDFWLGSWDVRPNGQPNAPAARNVITKIDDGCVVHESWSAPGSVGQSFNIYDRTRQKWFQTWVDNSGGLHEYSGVYRDNAMRYEGEMPRPRPASTRVKVRLTFFRIAADTVRQLSESPQQDGKWSVNYDLIYTKKPASAAGQQGASGQRVSEPCPRHAPVTLDCRG